MTKTKNGTTRKKLSPGDKIRIWMIANSIRPKEIALDLQVDRSAISHFLNGKLTSQRLREHFAARGCPEKLLDQLGKAA